VAVLTLMTVPPEAGAITNGEHDTTNTERGGYSGEPRYYSTVLQGIKEHSVTPQLHHT